MHRFALLIAVAAIVVGGVSAVWALNRDTTPSKPPEEVVVGESNPEKRPKPQGPASPSPSPSPDPSPTSGSPDDGVVDPPPAVTGDDDDDDDDGGDDDGDDD